MVIERSFMVISLYCNCRAQRLIERLSFCRRRHGSDPRIEAAGAVSLRHLRQRNDLDPGGTPGGSELLEALAAEIAQRIHRRLEKLARIEFASGLRRDLAERRGHRQPAIGVDIDLANTVPD